MKAEIRRARAADLPRARAMLSEAGLPVADLVEEHLAFVAIEGDEVVGVVGCEIHGKAGLLRSLVVAAPSRYEGLGRRLVARVEQSVLEQGVEELWLLTTDADAYFAGLGYAVHARRDAPAEIRTTAEFAALCPDDAVLMRKSLA